MPNPTDHIPTPNLAVEAPAATPRGELAADPEILISARDISKCYLIYDTPTDRLRQMYYSHRRQLYREFWALRNISFELKRGRSLGIIGHNGCGKSTLLQLVAGTLTPTFGEIHTSGRVTALLELGSAFNPEFSGRENVYLNGAILGLEKEEMDQRFESIAQFADIGDFLDMPVRTYSSGMMVRLAFAAAINVDADVLVIDEALAVGDAGFQLKCFEKLDEMMADGLTLLFVSHDSDAIRRLCHETLYLENGAARMLGDPKKALNLYFESWSRRLLNSKQAEAEQRQGNLATTSDEPEPSHEVESDSGAPAHALRTRAERYRRNGNRTEFNAEGRWGERQLELHEVYAVKDGGMDADIIDFGERIDIIICARANQELDKIDMGVQFLDPKAMPIFAITNSTVPQVIGPLRKGDEVLVRFSVVLRVRPGRYFVAVGLGGYPPGSAYFDWIPQARAIEVIDTHTHKPSGWGMTMPEYEFEACYGS